MLLGLEGGLEGEEEEDAEKEEAETLMSPEEMVQALGPWPLALGFPSHGPAHGSPHRVRTQVEALHALRDGLEGFQAEAASVLARIAQADCAKPRAPAPRATPPPPWLLRPNGTGEGSPPHGAGAGAGRGGAGLSAVEAGKLAEQQARLVQALEGRLAASVAKANELSARGAALERDNAELQRRVRESEAAAAAAQRRGEAVMQHAVEVLQDKAVAGAPRGAPAARAARGGAAAAAGGVLAGGERFHLRAELLELQPMAPRPRSGLEPQHADLSLGGDCADYPRASSAESPGLTPRRDASPHAPDAAGARARARALSSAPWPVTLHHPAATAVAGDASPASVGGGRGRAL